MTPRLTRELLEAVALAVIVFLVIQTSVQNFKVEGSSMSPTLRGGQYLLVNKLLYFRIDQGRFSRIIPFWQADTPANRFAFHPPRRGEVIVFRYPNNPRRDFVKRVVGLPGERVEIRQGVVSINGVDLKEPYFTGRNNSNAEPLLLGRYEYFVLGDNRGSSNDSRHWGPVPEQNVLGKVWVVYWPTSDWEFLGGAPRAGPTLAP